VGAFYLLGVDYINRFVGGACQVLLVLSGGTCGHDNESEHPWSPGDLPDGLLRNPHC
jgi:hypothetical protein